MSAPTKDELAKSYKETMAAMRTDLSGFDQFMSRLFHSRTLSFVLSLLGKTLFRAQALLIGSIASFLALVFFYMYAKLDGYAATGFEPLLVFIVGWIIGFVIDLFSRK